LPKGRSGVSLSVGELDTPPSNCEADTITELSSPQRNLCRQCLVSGDDVMMRRWGVTEEPTIKERKPGKVTEENQESNRTHDKENQESNRTHDTTWKKYHTQDTIGTL